MQWRNSIHSYGAVAKAFHWPLALVIIGMLAVGIYMEGLPVSPEKFSLYGWHKSVGVMVFALMLLRLGWKLMNVSPALPDGMRLHERMAAKGTHLAFYLLLLAMPVSGWLMSSTAGFPVSVFGWFTLPDLLAPDTQLKELFTTIHELIGYALISLISVHVAAALYHHFIRKDTVLRRMLPWAKS